MPDKLIGNILELRKDERLKYVLDIITRHLPSVDVDYEGCCHNIQLLYSPLTRYAKRYNDGEIRNDFTYEDYKENKNIQDSLSGFGLDPEKFWYLFLFLFDYSWGTCTKGIIRPESPRYQLMKFMGAISENLNGSDSFGSTIFKKNATLTLQIEGERKIIIDNPTAMHFMAISCEDNLNDKKNKINLDSVYIDLEKLESESNSAHISFLATLLIAFLDEQCPNKMRSKKGESGKYNKKLFVSRLICFAKLLTKKTTIENMLDSEETLNSFLRQYKDYKINKTNNIYFERWSP
jgi:hypothetical protein